MANESDPVVKEIPVYLAKALAEKLFLLQYPVRPAKNPYDYSNVQSARIKIKQRKIEMEMPIMTHSSHYDKSKGEQYALNVDGSTPQPAQAYFKSELMDKQLLTSTKGLSDTLNYAVGTLKDGEMHITPLKGVFQVRPSFMYLDKADTQLQKAAADAGDTSQDEEEAEPAKTITVKFARRETDRVKQAREKSYSYIQEKLSEEPWKKLNIHPVKSDLSSSMQSKLICNAQNSDSSVYFHVKPDMYMSKLLPRICQDQFVKSEMPCNVLSMTQLRTMPVTDQVRSLLMNSKIIRMSQLITLLPPDTDVQVVLRALQQVAVLVQGCWVVKSEVLYPKKTTSAHSGIPAEILCRARDYIMWCFTQNRYIIRKEVHSVVDLPHEDMKEILEQMSRLKVNKGWQFIFAFDEQFVSKHPEVVSRQNMLWEAKYTSLCSTFKLQPQQASS